MLQEVVDELRDRVSSLLFLSLAIEFLKMKFLSGMCPLHGHMMNNHSIKVNTCSRNSSASILSTTVPPHWGCSGGGGVGSWALIMDLEFRWVSHLQFVCLEQFT